MRGGGGRQEEGGAVDKLWRGTSTLSLFQLQSVDQLESGGAAAFTK